MFPIRKSNMNVVYLNYVCGSGTYMFHGIVCVCSQAFVFCFRFFFLFVCVFWFRIKSNILHTRYLPYMQLSFNFTIKYIIMFLAALSFHLKKQQSNQRSRQNFDFNRKNDLKVNSILITTEKLQTLIQFFLYT